MISKGYYLPSYGMLVPSYKFVIQSGLLLDRRVAESRRTAVFLRFLIDYAFNPKDTLMF